MHIRGVHIILLIPGGGRQHHVGEETGGGHAEIERHQQIELALQRFRLPLHLFRDSVALADALFPLNAAVGAEQVFQQVFMAFARRSEQIGAPDKQVARMVIAIVRLLAGEAQPAAFQRLYRIVHRRLAQQLRLRGDA